MNWTPDKATKLQHFQQLGGWWVPESCIGRKVDDTTTTTTTSNKNIIVGVDQCCAAQPLFTCHYRDKPSLKPCRDSPPFRPGGTSFW